MNKGDITIPVTSLTELMEYMSSYEKDTTGRTCVTVMDVYCPTWGSCNALKSTFKDLVIQDVDDQVVSLKFLQINAADVLDDLKKRNTSDPPLSPRTIKRPLELQKDLLPDFWRDRFQGQLGKAKPLFLFYKDCQYVNAIEGVNTPYIKRTIKQLIKERKPASEFITNADLLEQWADQFGPLESEVPWTKFCKAINVWCLFPPTAPPLNDEETKILMSAVGVEKGAMPMVSAKGVQDFVGEEKFEAAFHKAVPGYEVRVHEDREKKEAAEKEGAEARPPAEEPAPAPAAPAEEAPAEPAQQQAAPAPPKPEVHVFEEGAAKHVLGGASEVGLTDSFTLCAWVRVAEGAGYEERTNNDLGIFGCGDADGSSSYLALSLRELKPHVAFHTGGTSLTTEDPIVEEEWTHIAVTYDAASKEGTLYLNGTEKARGALEGEISDASCEALLGSTPYSSDANTQFLGKIGAFKITPGVSEEEVTKAAADKVLCEEAEGEAAAPPSEAASPAAGAEEVPQQALSPTSDNLGETASYNDEQPEDEGEGGEPAEGAPPPAEEASPAAPPAAEPEAEAAAAPAIEEAPATTEEAPPADPAPPAGDAAPADPPLEEAPATTEEAPAADPPAAEGAPIEEAPATTEEPPPEAAPEAEAGPPLVEAPATTESPPEGEAPAEEAPAE